MEHCAPDVLPQEPCFAPKRESLHGSSPAPPLEQGKDVSLEAACGLMEDMHSGARFMKGMLLGALLSALIWAGILLLIL
ncbi:MAG: hypothetical protein WHX93_09545 [bacterium]